MGDDVTLTQRTQGVLLDGCQAAVVNGQMADVEREEHKSLQFGKIVVAQLQIENDGTLAFQSAQGFRDVHQVGGLTKDIEAVLLHGADAGRNFTLLRTNLLLPLTLAARQLQIQA